MGTVPISVIMGFDYPLDASQVQSLLSVHHVIFLKYSIYVVNLDNKLFQQISTINFLNTNSDKFCLQKGYNMRLNWDRKFSSTSFWHTIWSLFVVVIRIWDWSRWRAGEKVFPTEITLTTTQPDITQVRMFHSRRLNLRKQNDRHTSNVDTGKFLPTYWSTEGLL